MDISNPPPESNSAVPPTSTSSHLIVTSGQNELTILSVSGPVTSTITTSLQISAATEVTLLVPASNTADFTAVTTQLVPSALSSISSTFNSTNTATLFSTSKYTASNPSVSESIDLAVSSASGVGSTSTESQTSSPSPTFVPSARSHSGLSNGAVAGIVIGTALGIAIVTCVITYIIMRRRLKTDDRPLGASSAKVRSESNLSRQHGYSKDFELLSVDPKNTFEDHLPQSLDDKTIKARTKTFLEQLELFVDNFYVNRSDTAVAVSKAEIDVFDTKLLAIPLDLLLQETRQKTSVIKHALIFAASTSISSSAEPGRALLPDEFVLLPRSIASSSVGNKQRQGKKNAISRR